MRDHFSDANGNQQFHRFHELCAIVAQSLKKWTVVNRWLPAVNRIREQRGWEEWDFLEIANETELADLRNILVKFLENPSATKASSLVWAKREDYVAAHGEITEDFETPSRVVEPETWVKNAIED